MNSKKSPIVKQILELNSIIKSLDPSIRSQAFEVLQPIFLGEDSAALAAPDTGKKVPPKRGQDASSQEEFFKQFDHKKPSDNVFLIAAWLYSQHGAISITSEMLKSTADATGLIVPGRPDMTFKSAQKKGKRLFTRQGTGYKPTVHGEAFLKETYRVKKGTLPLAEEGKG